MLLIILGCDIVDKYLKIDYVWDLEDMIDEENIIEQLDWKDLMESPYPESFYSISKFMM